MNSPQFTYRRLLPLAGGASVNVNLPQWEGSITPKDGESYRMAWGTLIYDSALGGFHVQTLLGVRFYPWSIGATGNLRILASDFS